MADKYLLLSLECKENGWIPRLIGGTTVYVKKFNFCVPMHPSSTPTVRIKCKNHQIGNSYTYNGRIYEDGLLIYADIDKETALYSGEFWAEQAAEYKRQKTLQLLGVACA